MIKLENAGERGGTLTLTLTPFDLLALQNDCERSILHSTHLLEELSPDSMFRKQVEINIRDARANWNELENARIEREAILPPAGA